MEVCLCSHFRAPRDLTGVLGSGTLTPHGPRNSHPEPVQHQHDVEEALQRPSQCLWGPICSAFLTWGPGLPSMLSPSRFTTQAAQPGPWLRGVCLQMTQRTPGPRDADTAQVVADAGSAVQAPDPPAGSLYPQTSPLFCQACRGLVLGPDPLLHSHPGLSSLEGLIQEGHEPLETLGRAARDLPRDLTPARVAELIRKQAPGLTHLLSSPTPQASIISGGRWKDLISLYPTVIQNPAGGGAQRRRVKLKEELPQDRRLTLAHAVLVLPLCRTYSFPELASSLTPTLTWALADGAHAGLRRHCRGPGTDASRWDPELWPDPRLLCPDRCAAQASVLRPGCVSLARDSGPGRALSSERREQVELARVPPALAGRHCLLPPSPPRRPESLPPRQPRHCGPWATDCTPSSEQAGVHWGSDTKETLGQALTLLVVLRDGWMVALCHGGHPRKFYYITLLRDPVSRYLSEWRHVQRGATWKTSLHMCDGRTPTPEELPPCYEGTDWSGCTLQEFMDCPYNLASNRQVRMLADLSLVGCYNLSFIPEGRRSQLLLDSAKKNLRGMAFFGLTEFQRKTQYLFERTFNLKFIRPFMQYNSTRAGGVEVDEDTIRRIEELNDLDMQLYDYAKDLFQQRYQYKRQLERREQRLKSREERLLHRAKEALPREEAEEPGRAPTEDYMSHIIEKW
ncbi:Heparan-sulfate 6-O-sulfotransferase 1 [Galemys pyrenaicus]|uniref:Heparan-sulfate 6-O-sulfotransferase n=1 Tax=Galemys pyrenaicus TaxID=202257 RepID=A0A8J6A9H8_GALPY|nr:Heparan-sulfate 6-O-sulfotransferase 1 [Galemys pyrenaicus]